MLLTICKNYLKIGGVAGAIATNSAEGANSGANAGEIVIVYNSLAHLLSAAEKEKSGTLKTYEEKKQAFCQQSQSPLGFGKKTDAH
ncbi:hypothetical protein [Photorhabdus cinerea]|uniref:Uncharacterized protein n=1 Tax=Photorhabdus cinerea TaxID=471575 RepID=A0A7X5TGB1_9GAMM|nr:hypothetical protein [Photorhabdus cinerea]NHB90647.1 hypothetical protein [Photorhabdus cinerea]